MEDNEPTGTLQNPQEDQKPSARKVVAEFGMHLLQQFPKQGVFLTGIENSDPWVDGVRRNQLKEAYDFTIHYKERIKNIHSLGIRWLRFGPAYSQTHLAKDTFDFTFTDSVIHECSLLQITIIADLLHFGLPEWLHAEQPETPFFQNDQFPEAFATYARAFCKRYKEIQFFTLVNEPFITAFFSAKIGIWNEQRRSLWDDDRDFICAIKNISRAAILAREAIENVWIEEGRKNSPIFVQNESFEMATSSHESKYAEAERFNLKRFAALDLILGHTSEQMKEYLFQQGLKEEDYVWFMNHGKREDTILGIDHYPTCVHIYGKDSIINCDPLQPYQLYFLVAEYWNRYQIPLLHTETNGWPDHALSICQKTYDVISQLRMEGYPLIGMGWFGDEFQVGWHHALVGPRSYEESLVGLFYKGKLQPVGELFSELLKKGFPPINTLN